MRDATRNDYDAISAMIFDKDTHIGSACFLWSEDKKHLYCITADHCTHNKDGKAYDIHIKYHKNGKLEEYTVKGDKMDDPINDVAIYELEYPDNADTIPFTLTSNLLVPPKNCYIIGYPLKNKTARSAIPAEFNPNSDGEKIDLNLRGLDSDSINRYDEIVGISGSGCYEIIGNTIKFFGIENKALNKDVLFKEVHCVPLSTINQILIKNKKTQLPKPTPSYITERIGRYLIAKEALNEPEFGNSWVEMNITSVAQTKIHSHFTSRERNLALFICGLSGIGKTRNVLNACKTSGYENTLYYKNFNRFEIDIELIKKHAIDNCETFNIIVDEATIENWQEINRSFYNYPEYFRFILIGTMPKSQNSSDENICILLPNTEKDIVSAIEAQYPTFNQEEIQAIYKLCYNDLRLAILISRLYDKEKKHDVSMSTSILCSQSTRLNDMFNSTEAILSKTISTNSNNKPVGVDINLYFYRLSLFVDIGFLNRASEEIDNLAKYFNEQNSSNFKLTIEHLHNINLGIQKEDYFELSPRALAKLAFEQQGWNFVKYRLDNFMDSISDDTMRKRFFDRVNECAMSKEVNEALASWFCKKYYKSDLKMLNYSNAHEAMMFIEHNPEVGLPWLKSAVNNASDNELKSFGSYINKSRRHVVWTCEHLANFKEYFIDCEEILFKLAENECEVAISNNSQGIWSGFFSIMLSNTEVPFYNRYDILIKRTLKYENTEDAELFRKAFSVVLADGNIRWLPPKIVGGVITPKNWQPKTLGDLIDAKNYVINKLVESFKTCTKSIQNVIIETLSKNMGSFICYDMLLNYKETLECILESQSQKNELVLIIEKQIRRLEHNNNDNEEVSAHDIEILKQWIEELKDKTLNGKLYEYLNRSIWSYGHSDEEKQEAEQLICDICEAFCALPDKLVTLKKVVTETTYDKEAMSSFAEHLTFFEETFDFFEIISYISNEKLDSSFLRGYYLGVYKKNGKLPELLLNVLDEIAGANADFVLWASVVFDISDNGHKRILSLLNTSSSINCMENIKYKEWYSFLSSDRKIELCNNISNCENRLKYIICFELLQGWIQHGEKSSAIYEVCIQLFEKCLAENSRFEIYTIAELLKKCPKKYHNQTVRLMISLFNFNDSYGSVNYHIKDFIHSIKNEDNEKIILEQLGEKLIFSNQSLRGQAMRGFFDNFSLAAVKEWIEEKPLDRAPLIAYHLDSPNLSQKEFSPLTKYLLTTYQNSQEVYKNFIFGGYNFVVYTPEDYYNKCDEWYELLKEYEDSSFDHVRHWAEYEKKRIENICNDYRRDQAERSRYE